MEEAFMEDDNTTTTIPYDNAVEVHDNDEASSSNRREDTPVSDKMLKRKMMEALTNRLQQPTEENAFIDYIRSEFRHVPQHMKSYTKRMITESILLGQEGKLNIHSKIVSDNNH
uniref:Uncharacterized protein n=1 Tax=Anopheles maculatus TaxID=74869 RepID=A0A182SEE4_9DIPT